jgi:UDP-glucuronate decarboxylase
MHPNDGTCGFQLHCTGAERGKDLTIYGDGSQTRSFQYVDDLLEGMIRMMQTGDELTGPVNLGNPEEFTILELARKYPDDMTNSRLKNHSVATARGRSHAAPVPTFQPEPGLI